jgi:hypothetical protein
MVQEKTPGYNNIPAHTDININIPTSVPDPDQQKNDFLIRIRIADPNPDRVFNFYTKLCIFRIF